MATLVSSIITKAAREMNDEDMVRWTEAEWVSWVESGEREIVTLRPDALTEIVNITLVAGTKQRATGIKVMDVVRNMGTDGTTPGTAIRACKREMLDLLYPGWHTAAANTVVQFSTINEPDGQVFYVFPPQPSSGNQIVEIAQSKCPSPIAAPARAQVISLDDLYEPALVDYCLYRANMKEAEESGVTSQRAIAHYQSFLNAIGVRSQGEERNKERPTGQPGPR